MYDQIYTCQPINQFKFKKNTPKLVNQYIQKALKDNKQTFLLQLITGIYFIRGGQHKLSKIQFIKILHSLVQLPSQYFGSHKFSKTHKKQCKLELKDFMHIQFPCLKELNLNMCDLASIQGLSLLKMPKIKIITLRNNNITSLKPLSKGNYEYLQELSLQFNKANPNSQLNHLQRLRCPKLELLGTQKLFKRSTFMDNTSFLKIENEKAIKQQNSFKEFKNERKGSKLIVEAITKNRLND